VHKRLNSEQTPNIFKADLEQRKFIGTYQKRWFWDSICFYRKISTGLLTTLTKKNMSLIITALTTGAGVNTSLSGLGQVEENIVIGTVDTAMPLQGLKVVIGSKTTIDIQGSVPLVSTFAKFMQRVVGSGIVGLILKVATGRIIQQGCSLIFTNGGATTPSVYAYSDNNVNGNGTPLQAVTVGLNALTNQTFQNFAGLFVTPQANVGSFDVVFADGTSQNMSAIEANALFATKNDTQATGVLDAVVTGYDNRDKSIMSVRVNATTAVTVLVIS
jgi:hypothetical protein